MEDYNCQCVDMENMQGSIIIDTYYNGVHCFIVELAPKSTISVSMCVHADNRHLYLMS